MDETQRNFNASVMTQIARYRMTKREDPCYLVVNGNTLQILRRNYLTSFGQNGSEYYAGLKVLIDNELIDLNFKIVGE